jgi:hypothetical protein
MAPAAHPHSDRFRAWIGAAMAALPDPNRAKLEGAVSLRLCCGLVDQKHISAAVTAVIGLLVDHGLIDGRGAVVDIHARWDRSIASSRMIVTAHETVRPEQRASLAARQKLRDIQIARWKRARAEREHAA